MDKIELERNDIDGKSRFEALVDVVISQATSEIKSDDPDKVADWLAKNKDESLAKLFEKTYGRISVRTKVLAYCLAAKLDISATNKLLKEYKQEALYVRNLSEIAIMRALGKKYSAEQLCELMAEIRSISEQIRCSKFANNGNFRCDIPTIESFLGNARGTINDVDCTESVQITRDMNRAFYACLEGDDEKFRDFLEQSIDKLSNFRERSRVEFLRYFLRYLNGVEKRNDDDEIRSLFSNVEENNIRKRCVNFKSLAFNMNEFFQGRLFDVPEGDYTKEDHTDFEPLDTIEEKAQWLKDNATPEDTELDKAMTKFAHILQGFLRGNNDISRVFFITMILYFNISEKEPYDLKMINNSLDKCGWPLINVFGGDAFDLLAVDMLDASNDKNLSDKDFIAIMMYDLEEDDVFNKYEGDYANAPMSRYVENDLLEQGKVSKG